MEARGDLSGSPNAATRVDLSSRRSSNDRQKGSRHPGDRSSRCRHHRLRGNRDAAVRPYGLLGRGRRRVLWPVGPGLSYVQAASPEELQDDGLHVRRERDPLRSGSGHHHHHDDDGRHHDDSAGIALGRLPRLGASDGRGPASARPFGTPAASPPTRRVTTPDRSARFRGRSPAAALPYITLRLAEDVGQHRREGLQRGLIVGYM